MILISEMMKRSRGQYTDKQVMRCSQLGGEFGREFHRLVSENMGMGHEGIGKKSSNIYQKDVVACVKELQPDALFDYCPPREHKAFPGFVRSSQIKDPQKLGRHLNRLSEDLDFWREESQEPRWPEA